MGFIRRFKRRTQVLARERFVRRLENSGTNINNYIANYKQHPYLNEVIGKPVDATQHQNGLSTDARIIAILTKSKNLNDKSVEILASSSNVWLVNNLFSEDLSPHHYLAATVFASVVNPDYGTLTKIARDPRSTEVHLRLVCFPSEKHNFNAHRIREVALNNPNMTSELIHDIVAGELKSGNVRISQSALLAAAKHKKISIDTAAMLVKQCPLIEVLIALASNSYIELPGELAEILSAHENARVRLSIALHKNHPDRMFAAFADESVWEQYIKLIDKRHIVPASTLRPSTAMREHFVKQQHIFSEFKKYVLKKAAAEGLEDMPFNWLMRSYGLCAHDIPFDDWLSGKD